MYSVHTDTHTHPESALKKSIKILAKKTELYRMFKVKRLSSVCKNGAIRQKNLYI